MHDDTIDTAGVELPLETTDIPAHLTLDPGWDQLTVIEYGSVWDGQPAELQLGIEEDERLGFLLDEPDGRVIAFMLHEPHDFDLDEYEDDDEVIWEGPRFSVPLLGLREASVGEIVLAVQGRYAPGEPTTDAFYFHLAIQEEDLEVAAGLWTMALEAGEQKARFGLGYTLVGLDRFREAYDHLRLYTSLTPFNAWAWCWLGQAAAGMGDVEEARTAYEKAIELEQAGSFETDADELLSALD